MPKAYWIVNNHVHDTVIYEAYKRAIAAPFARHGARFVVRAGPQSVVEGEAQPRSVVIEFPSYDAALACYEDPEYQAAKVLRAKAADGTLIIAEGYDP